MKIPILVICNDEPIYNIFKNVKIRYCDPRVEYYFLYGSGEKYTCSEIAPGCFDVFVPCPENVKEGCTVKTVECMKTLRDRPWLIRTNASSFLNIDNLINSLEKMDKDSLFVTGNVIGENVYGSLMIWNNKSLNTILQYNFNNYPFNDDQMFTILCRKVGLRFDNSLMPGIAETHYNFFYDPPLPENWILEKRPRNEFTTRFWSDIYSFRKYISIVPKGIIAIEPYVVEDNDEMCKQIMGAIRFMDRTNETEYIAENIKIMIKENNHKHDGELLYFIIKYGLNVSEIINSPEYIPDNSFSDIYFYCMTKGLLTIEEYKRIGTTTGTWRDP